MPLLQQRIDSRHFAELMAYHSVEPLGLGERLDVLFAWLWCSYLNAHREEGKEAVKPSDVMIDWWRLPSVDGADPVAGGASGRQGGMTEEEAEQLLRPAVDPQTLKERIAANFGIRLPMMGPAAT